MIRHLSNPVVACVVDLSNYAMAYTMQTAFYLIQP